MTELQDPSRHSWCSALGQGLLVLSNENVGTNTGFEYLPQWAQAWAGNRGWNNPDRIRSRDVPMARLLRSTHGVPPGERFGTELIRKAAAGARRTTDGSDLLHPAAPYGDSSDDSDADMRKYEYTIRSFLDVGTRNHEASAAFLSGEVPQFEWTPEVVGLRVLLEGCHYVQDASVVYA